MRVFIAEDQLLVRRGIEHLLQVHGIEVAGVAETADGLTDAICAAAVDLALLDIRMPPTNTDEGVRVAVQLRQRTPGFPVVLLSQYVEQLYVDELLADRHGAAGYLLKDRVFDDGRFASVLRAVANGETIVDPEVSARLQRHQPQSGPLASLTPREYDTLGHMASGLSNGEIAARLVVTEKAVAKHINGIFAKFGLADATASSRRVRAVLIYLHR